MKKRIILYVHYDPDGIVDEHIVYQIDAFFKFGCDIIFISNSQISNIDVIENICKDIIIRENRGFDFFAWKEILLSHPKEHWLNWDEIILMNSTCYGPIFPLHEVFETMDKKECDFWGITEYYADKSYDTHLQSYFINFRKSLFYHNLFFDFFRKINCYKSAKDVIDNAESKLTPYLKHNGFKYLSYINIKDKKWSLHLKYCQGLIYNDVAQLIKKI